MQSGSDSVRKLHQDVVVSVTERHDRPAVVAVTKCDSLWLAFPLDVDSIEVGGLQPPLLRPVSQGITKSIQPTLLRVPHAIPRLLLQTPSGLLMFDSASSSFLLVLGFLHQTIAESAVSRVLI